MKREQKEIQGISAYVTDKELTANKYVLQCFTVSIVIYIIAFILNLLNVFIINKTVMFNGFVASLTTYVVVLIVTRIISLSDEKAKYFILFAATLVYTFMGVYITYHVVLTSVLPFLYAILYSSKRVMRYTYVLTVISTIFIVYGGYYFGLCDANMALLTCDRVQDYVVNGQFTLTEVNSNPAVNLALFYVAPRCMIYIAISSVCNNIFDIINGSLEKAQLTNQLEQAKIAAEEANRAKSDFLAKMSHEIRTPINAVLGMNETILRESKEPETKKYAHDIKSSANSLLSIINDILDSAKIESGKMEIIPVNYEISSLLNDIYNMIQVRAKEKGLNLIFDIDPSIPRGYYGDDIRIKQVLVNLLTNGVKYTPKGTVTLRITSRKEGDNAVLCCVVKDTGKGIKEEDLGKLFSKFDRINEKENRHIEGTGMGMTITVQLLRLMGSELEVKSEYGEGSEFSFELVQKIVNEEPLGDFSKRVLQEAADYKYEVAYTAPDAKVLVVDDNAINRRVFRNLLKETKIQVFEAEGGSVSLEMMREQNFDLIFLDHMMPEMDGIETLHAMREQSLCEGVPVIMLTANAIAGAKENYLNEGFDDFLSKPIVPEKLDQMILDYMPEALIQRSEPILEQKQTEEVSHNLPDLEEFDFDYARNVLQSEEILRSTLIDFYHSLQPLEQKLAILNDTITQKESAEQYRIEVHALKSTAATVGALLLSKLARMLEVAASDGDTERIMILHPILMEEIAKHRKRIEILLPKVERETLKDMKELLALLDMLAMSLEQDDYDTADVVMGEIQSYEYPDDIQQLVSVLAGQVMNLETRLAMETTSTLRDEAQGVKV
nr:response regulator [Eubacterium sp.]